MKKGIFSLIMVFTLCFVNVNQVYADAGSLIIAGGSVASVGAGVIAGPAVVAVFCAMMAFGMNVELTQASEEAGMTKTQFLKTKIEQYCTEASVSANTFNNYILDQANVFQDGAISLTNKATNLIQKFCNWLFENEQVNENTGPSILDYEYEYRENGNFMNGNYGYKTHDNTPCNAAQFKVNQYYMCVFFRDATLGGFTLDVFRNDGVLNQFNAVQTGNYFQTSVSTGWVVHSDTMISWIPYNGVVTGEVFYSLFNVSTSNDSITGDQEVYDTSKGVLNPTQDQTVIINPNITIPVPQDKNVTIDVNEYLEVVQEMIDGLRDDVITAIDDATGEPITIEFDPTQDWDPTIEKEDDDQLPPVDDRTPIIEDNIIPSDFDPDPVKFDLKGIFPFCIPWDVKDMLSKLSADPVAPSYTVNWMVPIVNERLIFTVDLAPFNQVAQVCRTMELLAFCIGLAIVTRQLFLRG